MKEVTVKLKSSKRDAAVVTIPVQGVPDLKTFDVVVAEIKDPGHFYVQLGSEYYKLEKMMDELDDHYEPLLSKASREQEPREFSVGEQVAAVWPTDNLWYRGRVLGRKAGKWQVFGMDYGDTWFVEEPYIMPLDRNFCVLPAQAIRAHLSGIEPRCDEASNCVWSKEVTRRMRQLTEGSHKSSLKLIAMDSIVDRKEDWPKDSLPIWLLDHSGVIGINELLVEEEFAQYEDLFKLNEEEGEKSEEKGGEGKLEEMLLLDDIHEAIMKVDGETPVIDIQVLFNRSIAWANNQGHGSDEKITLKLKITLYKEESIKVKMLEISKSVKIKETFSAVGRDILEDDYTLHCRLDSQGGEEVALERLRGESKILQDTGFRKKIKEYQNVDFLLNLLEKI